MFIFSKLLQISNKNVWFVTQVLALTVECHNGWVQSPRHRCWSPRCTNRSAAGWWGRAPQVQTRPTKACARRGLELRCTRLGAASCHCSSRARASWTACARCWSAAIAAAVRVETAGPELVAPGEEVDLRWSRARGRSVSGPPGAWRESRWGTGLLKVGGYLGQARYPLPRRWMRDSARVCVFVSRPWWRIGPAVVGAGRWPLPRLVMETLFGTSLWKAPWFLHWLTCEQTLSSPFDRRAPLSGSSWR